MLLGAWSGAIMGWGESLVRRWISGSFGSDVSGGFGVSSGFTESLRLLFLLLLLALLSNTSGSVPSVSVPLSLVLLSSAGDSAGISSVYSAGSRVDVSI